MGSIVNPVSFRLGWSRYWSSNWSLGNINNFGFLLKQDFALRKYLTKFLTFYPVDILVSDIKIVRSNNHVFTIVPLNVPWLELFVDEVLFLALGVRKRDSSWFLKLWRPDLRGYRLKKYLLDRARFIVTVYRIRLYKRWLIPHIKTFVVHFFISLKRSLFLYFFQSLHSVMQQNLCRLGLSSFSVILSPWMWWQLDAKDLAFYIRGKFLNYLNLNQVVREVRKVLNELSKKNLLLGFKVMYKGRFRRLGRRGRATYSWKSEGFLPLNTAKAHISYCSIAIRLKYSTCGVKVWLFHA